MQTGNHREKLLSSAGRLQFVQRKISKYIVNSEIAACLQIGISTVFFVFGLTLHLPLSVRKATCRCLNHAEFLNRTSSTWAARKLLELFEWRFALSSCITANMIASLTF